MSLAPAKASAGAQSPVVLIIKAVLLETVRRREIYVLLLMMGLFLVGALVIRMIGIKDAATATFLLNLGMTLATMFAKLITLLTAARQFPDELEQRTLYPLLAKPLSRTDYLLGKWAASALTGIVTLLVLLLLAWLPLPTVEDYSMGTLLQMIFLEVASLGMLAALAILFSLLMPKALTTVVLVVLVLAGGKVLDLVQSRLGGGTFAQWAAGYIPDFRWLDLVVRYTDGVPPLASGDILARILYAAVFTVFPLALANWVLGRRSL